MIWKSKYLKIKPARDAVRTKKIFAFFPVRIGENIIFLEKYEKLQVYSEQEYKVSIFDESTGEDKPVVFVTGKWVTISKRICRK